MRFLLLFSLAGCVGIPGPAGDDDDDMPEPETVTCERSLGELLPSPAFDAAANALDVVIADLDRDGFDDVIALLEPDRVAVARARSIGGFAAPVELTLESNLRALATLDLDDDGDRDVVAAGDDVIALRNDAGTLVEEGRRSATCPIDVLAAGQFDDDLRPDVAVGCTASGALMLMRHGDGVPLDAPVTIDTFVGLRGVAAGEVAGDDRDDLVVFGIGVELLRAIGGGSFARTALSDAASTAAATGDLDADGRADVIAWAGDELAWLRGGDAPGALVPLSVPELRTPVWLEIGAIDGAAGDDVVFVEGDDVNGSFYRTLVITSPLTDASVAPQPGSYFDRCRLGRFVSSDEPDLACVSPYGPLQVPIIHRGEAPAASRPLAAGALLAQLDADPALEVLSTAPIVEVLEPAGDRFVVEASNPDQVLDGDPIGAIDWTGDPRPDLLVRRYDGDDGAIHLLPATGPAAFGAPIEVLDAAWIQLVVGDLDDDGYPDLAGWTLPGSGDTELHVAFGGPGGTIAESFDQSGLRSVAIADVIAGGAPELIVANAKSEIQIVDASERSPSVVGRIDASSYPLAAVVADLDADGDADLATLEVYESTTTARTYLRGDDDRFTAVSSHKLRGWVEQLAIADIDGDGALDMIAGALMLLRGQGDGRVAPPVPFARPQRLLGTVRAPAGAADQILYIVTPSYGVGTLEMLAPGCT